MGPRIYKVQVIGNGFLAVMAKPTAGEWIDDEFTGLASEGVMKVVSLLEREESYQVGLSDEHSYCERNGLEFENYPIPDRGVPDNIISFSNFTSTLYGQIAAGLNTVVHCRAGIGRAGLVAVAVMLHDKVKPKEAFKLVSAGRGVEVPDTEEQHDWIIENHLSIIRKTH